MPLSAPAPADEWVDARECVQDSLPTGSLTGVQLNEHDVARSIRPRLQLRPDCGLFPLWSGGGWTADGARTELGLDEQLVEELRVWGEEGDYIVEPDGWEERGLDLYRRLCEALGDDYDVVFELGRSLQYSPDSGDVT